MRRYNVFSTDQFDDSWERSLQNGVINRAVDEVKLEALVRFIAVDPRYFEPFNAPGESVDLRWVHFLTADTVRVEIWYSVVEDDLAVYLESVDVIYRVQQFLAGFNP